MSEFGLSLKLGYLDFCFELLSKNREILQNLSNIQTTVYPSASQLISTGDGLIERELNELLSARREQAKQSTYEVWIWTSDIRAAGTDSNVSLQVSNQNV